MWLNPIIEGPVMLGAIALSIVLFIPYVLCTGPAYVVGVAWLWAITQSGNTTR